MAQLLQSDTIQLENNAYEIVQGRYNYILRIDDSRGNTILRFDGENNTEEEESEFDIKDPDDNVVATLRPRGNLRDSGYDIYSVVDDRVVATVDTGHILGATMKDPDSEEEIMSVDISKFRRLYATFGVWPINALVNKRWKFNSPKKGELGVLEENFSLNPFGKPTNELNLNNTTDLTRLEEFGILCIGTRALFWARF